MSQENQSCLRFSLEESLWFRKGQEVEDLISISLDPDITIQENDQYVTIKGSLELTGEYKSYEEESSSSSSSSESEVFASQKFVESVDEQEEGNCGFSHRFPVDITIPNNRIQSIYDIDVLVESFDYSMPERSCLKLSAELTISGLYGADQQQVAAEEPEEQEYELSHRGDWEDDEVAVEPAAVQSSYDNNFLFEAEARKQQEEESADVLPKFPTFNYQPQEEEEEEEVSQVPTFHFQEARNESPEQPEVEQNVYIEEEYDIDVDVYNVELEDESHHEESSSSSSSSDEKPLKKKFKKKTTMTLTEFFARKDEEAEQTKVKVCIVQKGDTMDSLAERYDVTVQNLLRVNNLDLDQDVYEGQVLYIPGAMAKR